MTKRKQKLLLFVVCQSCDGTQIGGGILVGESIVFLVKHFRQTICCTGAFK